AATRAATSAARAAPLRVLVFIERLHPPLNRSCSQRPSRVQLRSQSFCSLAWRFSHAAFRARVNSLHCTTVPQVTRPSDLASLSSRLHLASRMLDDRYTCVVSSLRASWFHSSAA